MAEAICVEMAPPPQPPRRIFSNWRMLALLLVILLVILAGIFSWWVSRGRVSSVLARLDTLVYTVETGFATQLESIFVREGEIVNAGQPLGKVDAAAYNREMLNSGALFSDLAGEGASLDEARRALKSLDEQSSAARMEEDRLRKILEERVTEHVRSQLAMRSLDRRNRAMYEQASQAEHAARSRMEAARENFEQGSRLRAAIEVRLNRLRAAITRAKNRGGRIDLSGIIQSQPTNFQADANLYAPVAGRVLRIAAVPGQPLKKGETVFMILPLGENATPDCWVQAWFPLSERDSIRPGQKAVVRFENRGLHLNGTVQAVAADAEQLPADAMNVPGVVNMAKGHDPEKFTSKSYLPVRIKFDDPKEAANIAPGSRADCQVQTRYWFWDSPD